MEAKQMDNNGNRNIGFRITSWERKKLEQLSQQSGLNISDVMRSLIETAEVKQVTLRRPVGVIYREMHHGH
jgi:hypothetical protein